MILASKNTCLKIMMFILSIILTIIFINTISKECFSPQQIDIVITWVDNNPEFVKERRQYYSDNSYDKPSDSRYTDNQELKYLIRSIEKFFPTFNKIYIVVKDGQRPSYLRLNHPRLIFIDHSMIIPADKLPVFNSRAIETYIHKIPGLSNYYLYANDDVLFTSETKPEYFFDDRGIPYVLLTNNKLSRSNTEDIPDGKLKSSSFLCGIEFNMLLLDNITKKEDRYEVPHSPFMYNKTFDNNIENFFKGYFNKDASVNIYDRTGGSKFRRCDDLYLVSVIKPYLYKNWFKSKQKIEQTIILSNYDDRSVNDVKKSRFICLENINDNNRDTYHAFMNTLLPDKSNFEL